MTAGSIRLASNTSPRPPGPCAAASASKRAPITDQVRIPLLPDNDRTWYSVGATNKVTNIISVDLAYSFVDVKNTPINVVAGNPSFNGVVTYTGTSRANVSILSLGVKFKLDEPPPAVATRG